MPSFSSLASSGTVVALASAPGRAGVAVVRVSGPQAEEALRLLCFPSALPEPRKAVVRDIRDYRTGELIDHALVLWFAAPNSFTGEDVVEFHLHGGRAILSAVLNALCSIEGIRPAEPGAFSRRAFENGKLDLTEAEGLADLVDAQTTAQRRQALRQMDGELGRLYQNWADRLKRRLAFIEAEIDFSDEDLPPEITAHRLDDVRRLETEIALHLDDSSRGEKIREGFTVALLGAPNAGKSSLLNALTRTEAAIVAATPGTTRDVIEVQLDLGGYPVTLADTAGLRETGDAVEREGVRRALARAERADFRLLIFDGKEWPVLDEGTKALASETGLLIVNKADLISPENRRVQQQGADLFVSALTGEGLSALSERLIEEIDRRFVGDGSPVLTRARHRVALEDCLTHIRRALTSPEIELCAEDLRLAVRALGRITGRVDVEDLLDLIFSEFCIGK